MREELALSPSVTLEVEAPTEPVPAPVTRTLLFRLPNGGSAQLSIGLAGAQLDQLVADWSANVRIGHYRAEAKGTPTDLVVAFEHLIAIA